MSAPLPHAAPCSDGRYAEGFAAAGITDERLCEIGVAIDEDREARQAGEEEGPGEGADALEALITSVGLKGGSAVKLRRRLLDFNPRAGGGGGGSGGKGGGGKGGRGGGRGGSGEGGGGGKEKDGGRGGARGGKGAGAPVKGGKKK